jgi:hypothetical protein
MRIQTITFCTALLLSVCSITHAAPLEKGRIIYQKITFILEDENNGEKFLTFRFLGEAGEIMDEIEKMLPRIPNEIQTLYIAADKNNDHVIDEPEAKYFRYESILEQITSPQSRRVFTFNHGGEKNFKSNMTFLLTDDVAKMVMDDVERIQNMNFVDPAIEESSSISAREVALFRLYITADKNNDHVINGSDALDLREWLIEEYKKKNSEKQ